MFNLSYFIRKSYFDDDGLQNCLIFQLSFKSFKMFTGSIGKILGWKSKGLLEESITTPITADNSFAAKLTYIHNPKIAVKFEGNCLKQEKVSFTHRNVVNIFIVYELVVWSRHLGTDFTLKGSLFGAIKLTKNVDPDNYFYS